MGDLLEGALVGDGEAADLVDLVAEELDAQRVVLGRREHVDDAAAYGELAASLDQVDPRVGGGSQVARRRWSSPTSSPLCSSTGSRSARPLACGWSSERTGATMTRIGPVAVSESSSLAFVGCTSRRSTARRRPTVSERGDRRSCGSVSHAGK